jgi:hypothetical protein
MCVLLSSQLLISCPVWVKLEPSTPCLELNTKTVSTKDVEIILHKRVAEVKWQATHTLQYNKLGQPANLRASSGPRWFGVWGLGFRISRV